MSVWRVIRTLFRLPRGPGPARPRSSGARLPWWGLILNSRDKRALKALMDSGDRLRALMAHPGWEDAEAVVQDWIDRYAREAGRLGQQMEEDRAGQLVLKERDTPEDDRRRLIACAQSEALRGLLAELRQRSKVGDLFLARQAKERAARQGSEEASLV